MFCNSILFKNNFFLPKNGCALKYVLDTSPLSVVIIWFISCKFLSETCFERLLTWPRCDIGDSWTNRKGAADMPLRSSQTSKHMFQINHTVYRMSNSRYATLMAPSDLSAAPGRLGPRSPATSQGYWWLGRWLHQHWPLGRRDLLIPTVDLLPRC